MKKLSRQQGSSSNRWKEIVRDVSEKYRALLIMIALVAILAILSPYFLTVNNLITIALQTAVVGILAIAQLIVIISRGIDLSVGASMALAGVVAAMMMKAGIPIAICLLAALMVGAAVGLLNGLIITVMRVPPFIATLGTLGIARGVALVITDGLPVSFLPQAISWFGRGTILGLPVPVITLILMATIIHLILSYTRFGLYTYAIGDNIEATRLSGINTNKYTREIYTVAGLLTGVAGVLLVGRLGSAQPTAGVGYELNAIAAAVIGGASLMGGIGTVPGAVIGALIMGILSNGFTLLGISSFYQQIALGAVVILAVYLDFLQRRR